MTGGTERKSACRDDGPSTERARAQAATKRDHWHDRRFASRLHGLTRGVLPGPVRRVEERAGAAQTHRRHRGVCRGARLAIAKGDAGRVPGTAPVHALAVTIPFFLVVFAAVYLSLAEGSDAHFSQPLDHTGALYLAITIFSTVGFGDITPESELALIVVSIQMLLDLVVIGVSRSIAFHCGQDRKPQSPESGQRRTLTEGIFTPSV